MKKIILFLVFSCLIALVYGFYCGYQIGNDRVKATYRIEKAYLGIREDDHGALYIVTTFGEDTLISLKEVDEFIKEE